MTFELDQDREIAQLSAKVGAYLGGMVLAATVLGCQSGVVPESAQGDPITLVIEGGRVMDPESGLDAIRNVGITEGRIVAVSDAELDAAERLDATGLVVAPGFVDLHAHGQDAVSNRLQVRDGVTTALEMELGVYPVADWLASRAGGALINYGATVSHPGARTKLLTGLDVGHSPTQARAQADNAAFASDIIYQGLDDTQIEALSVLMQQGLDEGGLGLGFGVSYTPGATRTEIYRLFQMAAEFDVTAYIHLRGADSGGTIGAFQEAIANAASTGASVHIVHMNSTAGELARTTLEMIRGARDGGLDVTTEAYPYTAGSTFIESALFDSWEGRDDESYQLLQWPVTGERLTRETFQQYRAQGGWVVMHGRNEETNEWIVAQPDVMGASDGIPFVHVAVHPRGAGTFARVLGHYVRERRALGLMEALAKMTIQPARRLEGTAPAMRRKGRVQVGVDADLVLFDPDTVIDRSTYERPGDPSEGIPYVLVAGTFVVRDGAIVEGNFPGRAIHKGAE